MSTEPKTRREQADQAFVRSLGDISSPDQDDLDLIACERIKWHEAVQWADSTPAPSEQGDEEAAEAESVKRAYKMNEEIRDRRICFKDGVLFGIAHARRTKNAEVERLKKEVEELKDIRDADTIRIDELRSLLERAKGFADFVFGYNTTNGINPKYELEWLSDYEKLMGKKG